MNQLEMSRQQMANIASKILGQQDVEINKLLTIEILYQECFGKEPTLNYVSSCLCKGDYCDAVFLHGIRLDGLTIKEINEKIDKHLENLRKMR